MDFVEFGLQVLYFVVLVAVLLIPEGGGLVLDIFEFNFNIFDSFLELVYLLGVVTGTADAGFEGLVEMAHFINSVDSVFQILVDGLESVEVGIRKRGD